MLLLFHAVVKGHIGLSQDENGNITRSSEVASCCQWPVVLDQRPRHEELGSSPFWGQFPDSARRDICRRIAFSDMSR